MDSPRTPSTVLLEELVMSAGSPRVVEGGLEPWAEARAEAVKRMAGGSNASDHGGGGTLLILCPMRDRAHALDRFFGTVILSYCSLSH